MEDFIDNDVVYDTQRIRTIIIQSTDPVIFSQLLYKVNKFKTISTQKISTLKYAYSLLVLEYFKAQLSAPTKDGNSANGKGTVIDVTDA